MLFNRDLSKQAVEVIFSNKKKLSNFESLTFNGIPVKVVTETKHLGMILDNKLSFEKHIDEKIAKANKGLGLMKQLKNTAALQDPSGMYRTLGKKAKSVYFYAGPHRAMLFIFQHAEKMAKNAYFG